MANFWSGFTEGFTPTYLNTRARTDRKEELDRARQQLLSDRDIVRQQRLSDMAMDRQQRVDDRDAERAYQARLTAAAQKYAEDRERRKIIAAIQSTDPSVSEQAREAAFFAQPKEDQDDAMMARGGFPVEGTGIGADVVKALESRLEAAKEKAREQTDDNKLKLAIDGIIELEGQLEFARENQAGEARELDPSRMKGDVGYRDLGDEGLWGANARAARLQKGADAAKKIRADLAALGNQYGLVQGEKEGNAPFAARIEVAKNKAAVDQAGALARGELDVGLIAEGQRFGITRKENEPPEVFARRVQVAKNEADITQARKKAAGSAGGAKSINVRERATATLGFIRSIDAGGGGDALKNTREAFAEKDENGVIIKGENGEIVDRIDEATGLPEWEVYLASETVHGEMESLAKEWSRYRAVFQKTPAMLPDDVDNRGAAVARLTAEIEGELAKRGTSAQQFDLQQVTIAQNPDDYDEKTVSAAKAYLDLKGGQVTEVYDPETGRKIVSIGKRQTGGGVGGGVKPPTETAAERTQRRTFQSVLTRLDALLDESDKHDWTGVIPTVKAKLLDEIVPIIGIDKYADFERASFRSTASVTAWNLVRSLNEEGRLSDKDAQYLFPLVPTVDDEKPEFRAKLSAIKSLVIDKLQLQASGAGRTDAFSLDPETLLKSVDQPSEEFGGVVQIPRKYALSVIGNMPQYRFIGGDKTKPVTIPYIMGREGLTDDQRFMWIRGANIKR